jgi:thiol-disulfide isomerase/thioredoxin
MKQRLLLPLLAAALCAAPVLLRAADLVGQPLPSLAAAHLEGSLPDLQGKVVLVDFWASWCAPCKASFPAMADLQRRFAERGLVILAVSVDDNAKAYGNFIERQKPGFATVRDAGHSLVATMQAPTMPTSYLVDRHGVVRFRHEGFHGAATIASYIQQIEQLLNESTP